MDATNGTKGNSNSSEEMSEDEKTRLFNSIMDFEFAPEARDRLWADMDVAEAESPSHLSDDPPYGFRFPEQIELHAQGIYETMFDTLPEMDLIERNEFIL